MKIAIVIISFFLASQFSLLAQPQWKFHIAFEDATGAKDTIWLIWDNSATFDVDTQFKEQAIGLNYNDFNVFIGNVDGDTTKTQALPHPYPINDVIVYAINYVQPITISWDSSLFHAPGLPLPLGYVNVANIGNDYFFLVNNDPYYHVFNMLLENKVAAPDFLWGSQHQFPMNIRVSRDTTLGIEDKTDRNISINIFPNPVNDILIIKSNCELKEVEINSIDGKIKRNFNLFEFDNRNEYRLIIENCPSGFYYLKFIHTLSNSSTYEKIIIQN